MDFGALPPEINSTAIYSGPGSSPWQAAATAWQQLAIVYEDAATAVEAQVAALPWAGPSAQAMRASASDHALSLRLLGAQARSAATASSAFAGAYETARATSVTPALVAANRAQLATLVATNVLGQNTAAIMANEATYAAMWTQDAAAMYTYAANAQSATAALTPASKPAAASKPQSWLDKLLAQWVDSSTVLGQINAYSQQLTSSGTWQAPLEAAMVFSSMMVVSGATHMAMSALPSAAPEMMPTFNITPPPPSPTAYIGTGQSIGAGRLCAPPSWGQQPQSQSSERNAAPGQGRGDTEFSYGTPEPESKPIPIPLPMPVPMSVSRERQQKKPPEYGTPIKFVPRPPAGG